MCAVPGSGFVSRSDHQHLVRGFEQATSDPSTGLFDGRTYYDTTNHRVRTCVPATAPATGFVWVTGGNLADTDLPIHAARHKLGGADPLPNLAVGETMLRSRTLFQGVPSADVTLSSGAWTDVVTGLAVAVTVVTDTSIPPVTVGQTAWLIMNALVQNTGATTPITASMRVLDENSNVLFQSGTKVYGSNGGANDTNTFAAVYPVTFTRATPTLRMQVGVNGGSGMTCRKTQSFISSSFAVTSLTVVVG